MWIWLQTIHFQRNKPTSIVFDLNNFISLLHNIWRWTTNKHGLTSSVNVTKTRTMKCWAARGLHRKGKGFLTLLWMLCLHITFEVSTEKILVSKLINKLRFASLLTLCSSFGIIILVGGNCCSFETLICFPYRVSVLNLQINSWKCGNIYNYLAKPLQFGMVSLWKFVS